MGIIFSGIRGNDETRYMNLASLKMCGNIACAYSVSVMLALWHLHPNKGILTEPRTSSRFKTVCFGTAVPLKCKYASALGRFSMAFHNTARNGTKRQMLCDSTYQVSGP